MNNKIKLKNNFISFNCLILTLLTVLSLFCIATIGTFKSADAEANQYHYITADTTLLLEDSKIKGSISLPKSYYVQKTNEADTDVDGVLFKTVIYNGVKGKIRESSISKNTMTVNSPFYNTETTLKTSDKYKVMLKFNIPGSDGAVQGKELPLSTSVTFIAHTPVSEYFFVKCGNDYGFVEKAFCTPSDIVVSANSSAINPDDPIKNANGDINDGKEKEGDKKNNTVRIILICGICILSVLVVFLIFKPMKKKKQSKNNFYDM